MVFDLGILGHLMSAFPGCVFNELFPWSIPLMPSVSGCLVCIFFQEYLSYIICFWLYSHPAILGCFINHCAIFTSCHLQTNHLVGQKEKTGIDKQLENLAQIMQVVQLESPVESPSSVDTSDSYFTQEKHQGFLLELFGNEQESLKDTAAFMERFPDWTLGKFLGSGTSGMVYAAEDPQGT